MNTKQSTFVVGEGITQAIAHARAIQANGASYSKLYKAIEFLEQRKAR